MYSLRSIENVFFFNRLSYSKILNKYYLFYYDFFNKNILIIIYLFYYLYNFFLNKTKRSNKKFENKKQHYHETEGVISIS